MARDRLANYLRDIAAVAVVSIFMFPLLWWGLSAFRSSSSSLDNDSLSLFDFKPTLENFAIALLGEGLPFLDSRASIFYSFIVAMTATLLTLVVALPAANALSQFTFRHRQTTLYVILFQRFVPPIAIVVPLLTLYHRIGLLDTWWGIALVHAAFNLPFAILLLKSFFDEIPREVREAARIDGANEFTNFFRISIPLIRSGIAATAILAYIFSWIEFMLSLFLTMNIRTMPVQAALVTSIMSGVAAALTMTALIPAFIFLFFAQKHLVRGMTLGLYK